MRTLQIEEHLPKKVLELICQQLQNLEELKCEISVDINLNCLTTLQKLQSLVFISTSKIHLDLPLTRQIMNGMNKLTSMGS
jgi:hypothetical protein